jgi:hypothetical protein
MRRAAFVLVLVCASCRAVLGLEPPAHQMDDAPLGDVSIHDNAIDSKLSACTNDLSIVACFDFEGAVVDLAPSPSSVTASNVAFAPNGIAGQALAVDEASRVTIADSVMLDISEVTVEAWVRLSEPPPAFGRVGVLDVNGQYGMFIRYGGVLSCTTGPTFDAGTVPLDQWTHVACTAANGIATGYINGLATAQASYSGGLPTAPIDGGEIAGDSPGAADRLVGKMDLVRIYRVARSDAEICIDAGEPGCL